MAVILKGGAIFLHIPKTAGTWITSVLEEMGHVEARVGAKHIDAARLFCSPFWALFPPSKLVPSRQAWYRLCRRYLLYRCKRILGRYPDPPFLFTFVRHPLTWYESWFKYMSERNWYRTGSARSWHPTCALNGLGSASFDRFVQNVLEARPGFVTELYGWYAPPEVSFVGKQENLRQDLIALLERLGLPCEESLVRERPGVRVSAPVPTPWEPETRRRVLQLERAALARYGYEAWDDGDPA